MVALEEALWMIIRLAFGGAFPGHVKGRPLGNGAVLGDAPFLPGLDFFGDENNLATAQAERCRKIIVRRESLFHDAALRIAG